VKGARSVVLAGWLCVALPASASAQLFLASTPYPDFSVGPLFVNASVRPDLGVVTVNVSWSLTPLPGRRAADLAPDLYLLWPAEVAESTAPGPADPSLARYLEARGFSVIRSGRLRLRSRDRMQLGTSFLGEPVAEVASFAAFTRPGASAPLAAGTYVKIPGTPKLADSLSVMTLMIPLRGLIAPKPATWVEELFWGRRYVITAGFGDVGSLALPLYPLYFEQRNRVVHLAREFSMVLVNFSDSDHLRIEEISPPSATRRPGRVRAGTELVSLPLSPAEGIAPQTVKVQFSYFSGPIAWRPVLVTIALLLAGNFTGVLIFSRELRRTLRERRARRRRPPPWPGVEALASLAAAGTTYDDVVSRLGRPDEVHERVAPMGRRALLYRRSRREARELETDEIEVTLDDGHVREVYHRVRRHPDSF
jgi:hypothetical protein